MHFIEPHFEVEEVAVGWRTVQMFAVVGEVLESQSGWPAKSGFMRRKDLPIWGHGFDKLGVGLRFGRVSDFRRLGLILESLEVLLEQNLLATYLAAELRRLQRGCLWSTIMTFL